MSPRWPALQAVVQRLMLTADGMAPPGVDADTRLKIERRMLDLLVNGSRQVLLTSILIGPLLTTWLTLPHIGAPRALTLLLCLIALGVERIFLLRRIARARAVRDDTPRRWARALGLRSLLGSLVVVLWFYWSVQTQDRILISEMVALQTVLAAGGAALFTSWPPVMWAVVSTLLLGMVAPLAIPGNPERLVVAVFCVVLWLVLVSSSLRSARTLHSEALALLRNEDLVRELHDKHAQAEAANAAKSRFFAAANHDLRQPLQAMVLYLGVLQPRGERHADGGEDDADVLAHMRQCVAGMDRLLESLLDISRLEGGRLVPAPRALALQPLFERLADMHGAVARQKGLQLRVRATSAWVHSDAALLERALSNLLGNALRYTRRGGVLLAARSHGARVRVCVVDTGVGIPEAAHELIYEEFVQLNNPGRDPALGHGLGLPTVRRIATLLGLDLALRSRVGRGSAFTLELPATSAHGTPAPLAEADAAVRLRGRVLVVEDNALARDALARQLVQWGLEVQSVNNGEAARAALAGDNGFDAVLSDWRLPGPADGPAVLREARARLPALKLGLLITGEDAPRLQQLSPEFPVLRKPVRPLRLRALLQRHLRQR